MKRLTLVLAVVAAILGSPARADDGSGGERAAIDSIIASQIAAFGQDDGGTAYSYASPAIHQLFPTVETFMAMVRRGYPQVYRPQHYSFTALGSDAAGNPQQHVIIVGPDGKTYEAIYTMQRQPDGTWKINGCAIVEIEGQNV